MRRPIDAEESLKRMALFFKERAQQFIGTVRGAGGAHKSAEGMPSADEKRPDASPDSGSPMP